MRSTLISILTLALLSLCAQSSPLPLPPPDFSSRHSIPHEHHHSTSSSTSLSKRTPAPPASAAVRTAEQALSKKKDWKRPVVISISAIGLVMTVGWNYISLQSFLSNREKYRREQKRLQAEKDKPPPKVGDTMCIVQTYTTDDQVATRKPGEVKAPCYQLGTGQGGVSPSVASPEVGVSPPSVPPQGSTSAVPIQSESGTGVQQQQPAAQPQQQGAYANSFPYISPNTPLHTSSTPYAPAINPNRAGGLTKRELPSSSAAEEIIEETAPKLRSSLSPSPSFLSTSSSPPTALHHPLTHEERIHLLTSLSRSSTFSPGTARHRPGFPSPLLTPPQGQVMHDDTLQALRKAKEEEAERGGEVKENKGEGGKKRKGWKKVWKGKPGGGKLSTEDITFGLTVLNTIGNIPSLILTTINAYYYRGNPKVD